MGSEETDQASDDAMTTESHRDLIVLRDEIGREDGPGDIVFGPDLFDPRINGHAPYWEAILEAIDEGRIMLNGRPLTKDDLGKTAGQLFPNAAIHKLPELLASLVAQVEPIGSADQR